MAWPHDPDPSLGEHRTSCSDCDAFAERLLRFESRLERALGVAFPASDRVVPPRSRSAHMGPRSWSSRRGWLAMAASGLIACVVAGGLWLGIPASSLAAAVVAHMAGEPQAWRLTEVPVPGGALQGVLRDSHLALTGGSGVVSYAASCQFRGHKVPHLVVQTDSGPVTVMVLVHERVAKSVQFDELGYHGVIVPMAGHGSLAVLERGSAVDPKTIERIAHRVLDSIVWTG